MDYISVGGMIGTGYKNWFKISPITEKFRVEFDISDPIQLMSFKEACSYTCKKLLDLKSEFEILYSGGLDSEFVIKSFLENNVPFSVVLLLHDGNLEESKYAFSYCNENKIPLRVVDFCGKAEELGRELVRISYINKFPSELGSVDNFLSNTSTRNPVTGGGSPIRHYDDNFCYNGILAYESDFYLNYENGKRVGPFFSYTPEIFVSYLREYDYELDKVDQQKAKAKLFGLKYRPKMNQKINFIKYGDILQTTFKPPENSFVDLGNNKHLLSLLLDKNSL